MNLWLSHPFSQAIALAYAAMLHQFRRDFQTVHELADATLALSTEHGFTYYAAWARIMWGWVRVAQEHSAAGLEQLREGIEALQATGGSVRYHYYRALLAAAYRQQARALELRAAMSLSRLWHQQGKRAEARKLLAPICNWCTEGLDTADFQKAQILLQKLA
jgi:hypothetical protein